MTGRRIVTVGELLEAMALMNELMDAMFQLQAALLDDKQHPSRNIRRAQLINTRIRVEQFIDRLKGVEIDG